MTFLLDFITTNFIMTSGAIVALLVVLAFVIGPLSPTKNDPHVYPQTTSQVMTALYHIAYVTGLTPDATTNELTGTYGGRIVRIKFYSYDEPLLRMRLNNQHRRQFQVWSRVPDGSDASFEQRFKIYPHRAKTDLFGPEHPPRQALASLPPLDFNLNLDVEYKLEPNNLICTLLFDYRRANAYKPLLEGLSRLCETLEHA